jgi:Fe-S-cluster containining protein
MNGSPDVPIPYRIVALMQERNRLFSYPLGQLAAGVMDTRFRCTGCGACCTRAVNSHIFLLDHDVETVRTIDPAAYVPAPDPEFCDQDGTLYVSGYAVRMQDDPAGSCWFLANGKCRIYDRRFSVCRIYPRMLRRGSDAGNGIAWQQFARKGEHGSDDPQLTPDECTAIAREIKEYENAVLTRQITFLETIHEYFSVHGLRHDPVLHRQQVHRFVQGEPVTVRVFHAGELEVSPV